jgi:hypothetical protein
MSAASKQARAALDNVRQQFAKLSPGSPDEVLASQAADHVLATADDEGEGEPDIRQLLSMASDILTATPAGAAIEDEVMGAASAKSQVHWMFAVQILGTFLQNMRDVLCDGAVVKGMMGELQLTPDQLNALIGASVANRFGLSGRVIAPLAALLVMVVDKAAYQTFCQITNDQVIEKILHSASFG